MTNLFLKSLKSYGYFAEFIVYEQIVLKHSCSIITFKNEQIKSKNKQKYIVQDLLNNMCILKKKFLMQ